MTEQVTGTELVAVEGQKLDNTSRQLAVRRSEVAAADYVPHLSFAQVKEVIAAIPAERDRLLVMLIYDGCLRVSEGIAVRPSDVQNERGWQVRIIGKGRKPGLVAISSGLGAQILGFCYSTNAPRDQRVFPITRGRVHQIVKAALEKAGVQKPAGVGAVHLLRHSGAIERLARTGNPKALQDHLRHKSAVMTLRYLKTLSAAESLKIQKGVELEW